jgi:hypothetical protein
MRRPYERCFPTSSRRAVSNVVGVLSMHREKEPLENTPPMLDARLSAMASQGIGNVTINHDHRRSTEQNRSRRCRASVASQCSMALVP